jgi:hypothetical protein
MPVTKQSEVAYVLTAVVVNMIDMYAKCDFTRTIDGEITGTLSGLIEGPEFATLLATQATAGQPLGSEITDAIYAHFISKGTISGVIS